MRSDPWAAWIGGGDIEGRSKRSSLILRAVPMAAASVCAAMHYAFSRLTIRVLARLAIVPS